ncbi:hypothetical protein F4778DRAFT_753615 [Xylariomycetidae sp. FL2044]|nr:hypothetical protein F4778DRAFT_753615 [Xylariomycetidae sp. FL2044]
MAPISMIILTRDEATDSKRLKAEGQAVVAAFVCIVVVGLIAAAAFIYFENRKLDISSAAEHDVEAGGITSTRAWTDLRQGSDSSLKGGNSWLGRVATGMSRVVKQAGPKTRSGSYSGSSNASTNGDAASVEVWQDVAQNLRASPERRPVVVQGGEGYPGLAISAPSAQEQRVEIGRQSPMPL